MQPARSADCPTDSASILQPQNPERDKLYVVWKRRPMDFEALEIVKRSVGQSGSSRAGGSMACKEWASKLHQELDYPRPTDPFKILESHNPGISKLYV